MSKIFDIIKKWISWAAIDGLLHYLMCYAIVTICVPIVGLTCAIVIAVLTALIKEFCDYHVQKDNDKAGVIHDLIFDAVGIITAIIIIILIV